MHSTCFDIPSGRQRGRRPFLPMGGTSAKCTAGWGGVPIHYCWAPFYDLPVCDQSFELAITWNVVYHGDGEIAQRAIDEIRRVLVPTGIYVGTMLSKRNTNYGQGRQVRPDTFRARRQTAQAAIGPPSDPEAVTLPTPVSVAWPGGTRRLRLAITSTTSWIRLALGHTWVSGHRRVHQVRRGSRKTRLPKRRWSRLSFNHRFRRTARWLPAIASL
jgi:hypothetical protein